MAQPSYQFPAPSFIDKLDGDEAGSAAVSPIYIMIDTDGRATFVTTREEIPLGMQRWIVRDVDGRDALSDNPSGAIAVAYFPTLNAALL